MIYDCSVTRNRILNEVKSEVSELIVKPSLAIVTCSTDEASKIYVKNKIKTMQEVGITVNHFDFNPATTTQAELEMFVAGLNFSYNATIVQLPLVDGLDSDAIIEQIKPEHDVDGLTLKNVALLRRKDERAIVPCTAQAVFELLQDNLETLEGEDVLIVGRSSLIGSPLQSLLTNHNMTVTLAHSKTKCLSYKTFNSKIVVIGIGKPEHFCIKDFAGKQIIIDCGISRVDGKIKRDVNENVSQYNCLINKVGIVTTAIVAQNTLKCYKIQNKILN